MPHIRLIPARHADPELRDAYRMVAERWGIPTRPLMALKIMQCFGHRPSMLRTLADGYYYVGWCGQLDRATREIVAVLVSKENRCFYCTTGHVSFLQAAGLPAARAARIGGTEVLRDLAPHEKAIEDLVRKSVEAPGLLEPADLAPIARALGRSAAVEVMALVGAFHFINRIADLVGIRSDVPFIGARGSRSWVWGVRVQGWLMKYAMADRPAVVEPVDLDRVLVEFGQLWGSPAPLGYRVLHESPSVAAWLQTVVRSLAQVDPNLLREVRGHVAGALPKGPADLELGPRPAEPLEALAFVATRHAYRTTDALVDALRRARQWSDAALTDAFFAIAACNCFERLNRILATPLHAEAHDLAVATMDGAQLPR